MDGVSSFFRSNCFEILKIGLITGGIFFVLGYVGPILLFPGANQGPLLGIFITGPLGLIAGVIYWAFKKER